MTAASFRCAQVGHLCNGTAPPVAPFDVPLESCQANPAGRLIPVQQIAASIRALKQRPDEQIVVLGIVGWPREGSEGRYRYVRDQQGNLTADGTGLRMKAFVESFAGGIVYGIDNAEYGSALTKVAAKLGARLY
jgi:hypothetical protein